MKYLVLRFVAADSAAVSTKFGLIAAVLSAAIVTAGLGILTRLAESSGGYGIP